MVDPIEDRSEDGDVSTGEETESDSGVEMATGNMAGGYHHGDHQRVCHGHSKQSH